MGPGPAKERQNLIIGKSFQERLPTKGPPEGDLRTFRQGEGYIHEANGAQWEDPTRGSAGHGENPIPVVGGVAKHPPILLRPSVGVGASFHDHPGGCGSTPLVLLNGIERFLNGGFPGRTARLLPLSSLILGRTARLRPTVLSGGFRMALLDIAHS